METILSKNVLELINMIPDSYFNTLATQTQVDYEVHKLKGKTIFQLLRDGVLTQTRLSFNVLVSVFDHVFFRQLTHLSIDFHTAKSSLADRWVTIKVNYFADLFAFIQQKLISSVEHQEANFGFGLLRCVSNENILFVTRLKLNSSFEVLRNCFNCENRQTDTLKLLSNRIVYLCSHSRIVKKPFRLIKAIRKTNQEQIWFLTNHLELSAKQIIAIYRKRWEIERFFRFIKQELHRYGAPFF